jgi:hypothetical protein
MTEIADVGRMLRSMGHDVHDLIFDLPRGTYPRRPLNVWELTALHYTASWTERDDVSKDRAKWSAHARYHRFTRGWPGIAYDIGISPSGRIFLLHYLAEMSYHAFNTNAIAKAVACDLTWGQVPTPEMLIALQDVFTVLHYETPFLPNLTRSGTFSHNQLRWHDWRNANTNCAGVYLDQAASHWRNGQAFAPDRPQDVEPKPDHAKIDVPGIGERWVIPPMFARWTDVPMNVLIYGYPITGMFTSGDEAIKFEGVPGQYVQVFERSIFHCVPNTKLTTHGVHLARVGALLARERYRMNEAQFKPVKEFASDTMRLYVPQTEHSIAFGFKQFWQDFGSVERFGYPISEEFDETDENGVTRVVQYFERARFEWHPGVSPRTHDVLLGRVGAEYASMLYTN